MAGLIKKISLTAGLMLLLASAHTSAADHELIKDAGDELIQSLEEAGYWVGKGEFKYFETKDCEKIVETVGHCYGNNPASPYGLYFLPPAPGEYRDEERYSYFAESMGTGDLWPFWRMQKNEAIIFIGLTPPPHAYFGFRSYVYSSTSPNWFVANIRPFDLIFNQSLDPNRRDIFASLGPSLNNFTINTADGESFNSPTAVITTADTQTEQDIREHIDSIFTEFGLGTDAINTDKVPANYVKLGYRERADNFMMLARSAYPESEEDASAYRTSPPVTILRVVPPTKPGLFWPTRIKAERLPERKTTWNEKHLKAAQDALVDAVIARYSTPDNEYRVQGALKMSFLSGYLCIWINIGCLGDNPDTTYTATLGKQTLADNDQEFIVAVGINHTEATSADGQFTGKAAYTNLGVYNGDKLMGVTSMRDREFKGSTESYLPFVNATANGVNPVELAGDQLYAVVIARNCNGFSHCLEVPTGELGLPLDANLQLITRAYVNPETLTGPDYGEILSPKYVRFQ